MTHLISVGYVSSVQHDSFKWWLGSQVASMLDSGAERPGFTHRASVHQAAKLVAAFLRVAGVTAGLAESNGSLPPGL